MPELYTSNSHMIMAQADDTDVWLVIQQDDHFQLGQMKGQGKWSGNLGLIELLITYALALNIFQGLPNFMPILRTDLLMDTKIPRPYSQKKGFWDVTSVLVAGLFVCVSVYLCACTLKGQSSPPNTRLNLLKNSFQLFLRAETFFPHHSIVGDGNELT